MIHESGIEPKAADLRRRSLPLGTIPRKSEGREGSPGSAIRQRVGNEGIRRLMTEIPGHADAGSSALRPSIQAKLSISHPRDSQEQEADRVANAVMRMPVPGVQRLCSECEGEEEKNSSSPVQRKEQRAAEVPNTSLVATSIQGLRSGGSPLTASARAFFEPRFGADFSGVRVQTGAQASDTAAAIDARAFTVGNTIVFGAGNYAPESHEGRHLLAHELTHVMQQDAGGGTAAAERVQRTIGDKHELSSPRFKGDADLEACYDDEARLTMDGKGKPGTTKIERGAGVMKVQQALVDLGYLAPGLADGKYSKPTWDAVKALKTKEALGWETMGDVGPGTMEFLDKKFSAAPPGPAPSPSPVPPAPPAPPAPAPHVCGPDIDAPLTKVLTDMQTHFRALGGVKKHLSCQWLITPPWAIMAWDIHQLFLPETGWLRAAPFRPACGEPPASGSNIEDPATCGNSVRVGGKCNLAGTANYATWGVMTKECHDYYSGSPSLSTWSVNTRFFTESAMQKFIGAYKFFSTDDPGPPKEFAVATYKGGPGARPTTENRSHCTDSCPPTVGPVPSFTFVWEPEKAR